MEVILKNPLAGEVRVRSFSRSGECSFFLMKTYGVILPHRAEFSLTYQQYFSFTTNPHRSSHLDMAMANGYPKPEYPMGFTR
jgi:hypothetical protein